MNKRGLFKLVTVLGVPVLALLVCELTLGLAGYRTTYETEDPFLGFKSVTPLFEKRESSSSGEAVYQTRRSKLEWFNEQEFDLRKPPDGYRIFAFGGSTTFGRPYDHRTAFPNWLQVLLRAADPSTRYEVINVGGVSYASYRIVNLMNEIVTYDPDLFIVYTGHNEFLEERTYSEILEEPQFAIRVRTWLHRSRIYSLARHLWQSVQQREEAQAERKFQMSGEVSAVLDQSFGLDQYQREPEKHEAIVRHFRYNREKMVEIAESRDVGLVFVVPAANEKDFSPFKSHFCGPLRGEIRRRWRQLYDEGRDRVSQGRYEAALHAFRGAAQLDDCHADLH